MNTNKIITGGLVAGLVMNIFDYLINVPLLGEQWIAGSLARGIDPKSVPLGGSGWVIVDFIIGIFLAWLYAAVRPRFSPGPKTALIAGFATWLLGHLIFFSHWFMGVFPIGVIASSSFGGLISVLIAAMAGCKMYKE
jgi:hypothetical protein